MIDLPNISIFTNTLGLLFGLSAMAIVATAARTLAGAVRRGMIAMIWGLALIAASFMAVLFGLGNDAQMVLLSFGMVMILIASHNLFSLYRPDKH
ncbi:MAG: hypothetical protein AAB930_02830 [Patescibacteria group bacterium]